MTTLLLPSGTSRSVALLACLAVALAAPDARGQYALRADAVAAGATDASGGGVRLRGTVGQPAAGRVAGASYALGQGFWYPATAGGGPPGPALSVTATPLNPPIVIPAAGGEFRFRVTITNNTAQTQTFQAWINATLPNGSTYHVQGPQSLTLGPNATFGPVTLRQQIPGWAPAGTYAHNVRVGTYPNNPVVTGSFPWTKTATAMVAPEAEPLAHGVRTRSAVSHAGAAREGAAGSGRVAAAADAAPALRVPAPRRAQWVVLIDATGVVMDETTDLAGVVDEVAEARIAAEEEALAAAREAAEERRTAPEPDEVDPPSVAATAVELPSEVVLAAPFPNPFAGRTTFRFALPEAARVRLTVYDLLGRAVAVLVDERREAGWHEGTLDGSALASGVYVGRLEAGGQVRAQRVSLVR